MKAPFGATAPFRRVPVATESVFDALVAAAERFRHGLPAPPMRLFLDGVQSSDPAFLPLARDGSLESYARRVETSLRGRRFCLVVSNLQSASFALFRELCDLLGDLYGLVGVPPFGVEAGVFLGNYEATAFGVHQDRVGVLMLGLAGEKTMRLWAPDVLDMAEVKAHGFAHAPLAKRATTIACRPSDLVYWPAGFWHVGESSGFSATLNVGFGTHGGTASNADAPGNLADRVSAAVRSVLRPELEGAAARGLPESLKDLRDPTRSAREIAAATTALARTLANDDLALELAAERLNRATGFGFRAVPAPLAQVARIGGGSHVRVPRPESIAWLRVGSRFAISANGHSFVLPFHPAFSATMEQLSRGGSVHVDSLVRRIPRLANADVDGVTTRVGKRMICALLERLASARALV